MLTDLLLAATHHLLVFALISMLVAESVLLRGPIDAAALRRLAGLDAGYGMSAVLLLVVGVLRLIYGIKGHTFYDHNPWFHAKFSLFVLVALLSILPTVRFMRWRRALKRDPNFLPDPRQVGALRLLIRLELVAVAGIFVCAAAMARYGGF
ncbi:DUF2214 family protein [Lysobacter sp. K5869]|uniref:DUF2214 family protein n=1 Tax=Lysobacter sp. K5869 TaxID=2820808 RepID=UPI001C06329A|nr:DUF2214 family protein [Lysobacter sp. K5869]QWP75082.1 DUF2214 family protein [Lysobacter sp. K5869]